MDWKISVAIELGNTERATQKEPEHIAEQLEEILDRLKSLKVSLDEQVIVGWRTASKHLIDGMNSDVPAVRADEFVMARREFSRLTSLDPTATTMGQTGVVENKYLICLGYWGNYYYFLLRQDQKSSAIQIYECAAAYPRIALLLFPPCFFSKPYLQLFDQKDEELNKFLALLEQNRAANFWGSAKYYSKQTGRVIASGTVAAGGALVGLVTAAFNIPAGAALAAGGFGAANDVYKKLNTEMPQLLDVQGPQSTVVKLSAEIAELWQELETESTRRKEELQRVTMSRLLGDTQIHREFQTNI